MRICFASYHNCIRVFKQFVILQKRGVEVHSLCHRVANQDLMSYYPSLSFYNNDFEYCVKVSSLDDVDLIHFHNEPNHLGRLAKQNSSLPVIMDCHDLDSVRCGVAQDDEIWCFKNLDGFIFPSVGYRDASIRTYGLDPSICEVMYSMVNEDFFVSDPLPRLGGIVYEGGVVWSLGSTPDLMGREYVRMAAFLKDINVPFTIFGADHEFPVHYIEHDVICHLPQQYRRMIKNLSRYDWGLFGNITSCPQCDNAMPNKIFEYLAGGLPIIVLNAKEAGEWVEENGFGVNITKMEDIRKVYADHEKYRKNVVEGRWLYTMESQTNKLFGLYGRVLNRKAEKDASSGNVGGTGLCEHGLRICESSEDGGDRGQGDNIHKASV